MLIKATESSFSKIINDSVEYITKLVEKYFKSKENSEEIMEMANEYTDADMEAIQTELSKYETTLGSRFMGIMGDVVEKAYNLGGKLAQSQIQRITPKAPPFALSDKDKRIIKTLKDTDFSLIKTLSKNHITEARFIFVSGLHDGLSQAQIVKEMNKRLHNTEYQARRIVRTELTRTAAISSKKRYEDVGIKYWQWNTAKDERVCKICAPLHGKTVKIGDSFNKFLSASGLKQLKGKVVTMPPAHPFCRCGVSPSFKKEEVKPTPAKEEKKGVKIRAKYDGFSNEELTGIKKLISVIPNAVKNLVKSLRGHNTIVKTKGSVVDDPEVKALVSPAVLQKYKNATGLYIGGKVNKMFVSNGTGNDELLHEVGHGVHDEYLALNKQLKQKWDRIHELHTQTGDFISARSSTNPDEHFADAFRYYLLKPEILKLKYPEIYEFMYNNVFMRNETENIVTLEDGFSYKNSNGIWKHYTNGMLKEIHERMDRNAALS